MVDPEIILNQQKITNYSYSSVTNCNRHDERHVIK